MINPPFAASTSATNVPYRLGAPFPVNANLPTIYALDPTITSPYTHRFNFAVEQRIGSDTSITAAYVAARGRNLFRWLEANGEGLVPQALRPDSTRYSDTRYVTNASASDYNSLQITARRRFSRNIDFTVAYTFARSEDDFSSDASYAGRAPSLLNTAASAASGFQGGGASFTERPRRADWGLSDFDVRHSLIVSHIFDLPFGRGQRFLSNAGGLVNALVGGFSLRGIAVFRSGEPFSVTLGTDANDDGSTVNDYPALANGSLQSLYANNANSRTQYLLPRMDALALLGTPSNVTDPFDNIGRNAFRSPNVQFYDLSLVKRLQLRESLTLGLELNAFNVFNRTQLAAPVAVLSSASFGQVTATCAGTNARQIQLGIKLNF